jgi:hypothetical protein
MACFRAAARQTDSFPVRSGLRGASQPTSLYGCRSNGLLTPIALDRPPHDFLVLVMANRPAGICIHSKRTRRKDPLPSPRCRSSGGGHFPNICAESSLKIPYIDYAIRGQGESTLTELLDAHISGTASTPLAAIDGLSWRDGGVIVHNKNRAFSAAGLSRTLPYERLGKSAPISVQNFCRPPYHRLSSGPGLPLPLHFLRRGIDVSRQDRAAGAATIGAGHF